MIGNRAFPPPHVVWKITTPGAAFLSQEGLYIEAWVEMAQGEKNEVWKNGENRGGL